MLPVVQNDSAAPRRAKMHIKEWLFRTSRGLIVTSLSRTTSRYDSRRGGTARRRSRSRQVSADLDGAVGSGLAGTATSGSAGGSSEELCRRELEQQAPDPTTYPQADSLPPRTVLYRRLGFS